MGLAASQARLLTITARKSDCEFESMKLSHEKIALSRDMERISDEYQAAMNQTKLVYDYYGSGTSVMDLSYGLLMTPSVYNDYYPKLLTDSQNRIVLSGAYATAAKAAGIPQEGYNGTPSSEVRNAFIEVMRDLGLISAATAANIESVSYNNAIGLGATFSAAAATQDITLEDFMTLIKANCADTRDYGLNFGDKSDPKNYVNYFNADKNYTDIGRIEISTLNSDGSSNQSNITQRADSANSSPTAISLYDLLNFDNNKQYTLCYQSKKAELNPIYEAWDMQQRIVGTEDSPSLLNWMVDQFSSILGGVPENDLAIQAAYDAVCDLLCPTDDIEKLATYLGNKGLYNDEATEGRDIYNQSGVNTNLRDTLATIGTSLTENRDDNGSWKQCEKYFYKAYDYIGAIHSSQYKKYASDNDGNNHSFYAINLNNVAKVFLTAYVEYLTGSENYSYKVGQSTTGKINKSSEKASLFNVKENKDYVFKIKASTEVTDGTDNLVTGYYDALFNRICMSGWTENDNITNIEYMQELLKTGAVYISSINNDGNYYQNSYSTDTYISEVSDTEGIAQAEAKYNAAKSKIEHKENTIDMKMKNLDTEISSLTTEYDTMKNVISKTIEKTFKRYDA